MAYRDLFMILVVDSRVERSPSLRDALGHAGLAGAPESPGGLSAGTGI